MVTVRIKKLHPDVKLPLYSFPGDAGLDVFSREEYELKPGQRHVFKLGFSIELPIGYVSLIWDRSGMAVNRGIHCLAGVVDAGYRGEYAVVLYNTSNEPYTIRTGEGIAQLLIQPVERAELVEVESLSESERGSSAFIAGKSKG